MIDFAPLLAIVKDIALTIAGITGTIVAVRGLNTWRRQLRGQSHFEVARKVLRCTYRYRDALAAVRNPLMWPSETVPFPDEPEVTQASGHSLSAEQQRGYRRRFEAVREAGRALEAELLEAEVLWGRQVIDLARPLSLAASDLRTAVGLHFMRERRGVVPESERQRVAEETRQNDEIVYALGAEDVFGKRVEDAVAHLEALVRTHLGTGRPPLRARLFATRKTRALPEA